MNYDVLCWKFKATSQKKTCLEKASDEVRAMESQKLKHSVKDRILDELGNSIKLLHRHGLSVALDSKSWLVQGLSLQLDHALLHGLHQLHRGYWPFIKKFTHKDTTHMIEQLKSVSTSIGRGRAWLYHSLNEGTLESHLLCFARDRRALQQYYSSDALLRDSSRMQVLLSLVAGLEHVQFDVDLGVLFLDVTLYDNSSGEDLVEAPSEVVMDQMSSSTISLPSPGDSGVALLDSDAEVTSVSGANDLDMQNVQDGKDDDTYACSEIEDNRINRLLLLEMESTDGEEIASSENSKESPALGNGCEDTSLLCDSCESVGNLLDSSINDPGNMSPSCDNGKEENEVKCQPQAVDGSGAVIENKLERNATVLRRNTCATIKRQSRARVDSWEDLKIKRVSFCGELEHNSELLAWSFNEAPTRNRDHRSMDDIVAGSSHKTVSLPGSVCVLRSSPPVAERGAPEGQEDPPRTSSVLNLHHGSHVCFNCCLAGDKSGMVETSDVQSEKSSEGSHPHCKSLCYECTRGSSLGARLLQMKACIVRKVQREAQCMKKVQLLQKKAQRKNCDLFIYGVKPDFESAELSLKELEDEVKRNQIATGHAVAEAVLDLMKSDIFTSEDEQLYKVFKVRSSYFSGKNKPLLAVLTDRSLYLAEGGNANKTYCSQFSMLYSDLDAVIVGPNWQLCLLVGYDSQRRVYITTGGYKATNEFLIHLEIVMRRCVSKPKLPAIGNLSFSDMKCLKKWIATDSWLKDEEILHYCLVHIQDAQSTPPATPLGSVKEGHLMHRSVSEAGRDIWDSFYFILKAGVLYRFKNSVDRIPQQIIALTDGACEGCRRIVATARPHMFEVILRNKTYLQFAAADDYETSEWLQAILQAASGMYEVDVCEVVPCSLVVTSKHVLTCREEVQKECVQILSCAPITDITSFNVCTMEDSWCTLDFDCREACEVSGDWIVFFPCPEEMLLFYSVLQKTWHNLTKTEFPVAIIKNKKLLKKCTDSCQQLSQAWDSLLNIN